MSAFFPGEDLHRHLTPEQESHYIAEFALRRKRQSIGNLSSALLLISCIIVFGILVSTEANVSNQLYLLPLGLGITGLFANAIFQLVNYRCPQCNSGQARVPRARFCHNCGIRLRRDRNPK